MNILNKVASNSAERHGLELGNDFSFYLCVDGSFDYVGEGWLQTFIPKSDDIPSTRRTLHGRSSAPRGDTDMVLVCVQLIDENILNVSFPYDVSGVNPEPATFEKSANLYFRRKSSMALSRSEKHLAQEATILSTPWLPMNVWMWLTSVSKCCLQKRTLLRPIWRRPPMLTRWKKEAYIFASSVV